ncbi:MAG: hypothetical protein COA79_04295 [Planctomycetota bacterium]|nr:MAG: hypothetical protein COA79_04295 [Planctomycetota bacterium]
MFIFNYGVVMSQEFISRSNYYFSQTPAKVPGDRILRVAHEKWGPNYNVFRPNSLGIGLAIVMKGKCTFKTDENTWVLSKGCVGAFGPGPSYSIKCDLKNPAEIMIVAFCGGDQINLAKKCIGGTCLGLKPSNSLEISRVYELMLANAKDHAANSEEICNSLIPTLLWTINRGLIKTNKVYSSSQEKFMECKRFIDKNFLSIISVSEVASANHTSHVHLCRLFNKYAQVSPNLYFLKLKMNHAAQLLQFTDQPIKSISFDLGFSDQYVFSKIFKRLTKISPQHFRNSC